MSKPRKTKPAVLRLSPGSARMINRLAAVLAFEDLDWQEKDKCRKRAIDLLDTLLAVRP